MTEAATTLDSANAGGGDAGGEIKSLDYYLANPSQMPTDPDVLEKIFAAHDEAAAAAVTASGGTEPKPDAGTTTTTDGKAGQPEPKIDGVLTKDGKSVIPYAEMERRINDARTSAEAEAAARAAAEGYATTLKTQLEQAAAELASLKAGGSSVAQQVPTEISPEVMARLEEDFPTVAEAIKVTTAQLKLMQDQYADVATRVKTAEQDVAATEAAEAQALIDSIPDLKGWQKNAPYLFSRAVEVERELLGKLKPDDPLFLDDTKRYAEVVKTVKREVGLPAESPKDTTADLTRKADEIVAGADTATPRSISDLAGGAPPAGSETESIEKASGAELAFRFKKLGPEETAKLLARL